MAYYRLYPITSEKYPLTIDVYENGVIKIFQAGWSGYIWEELILVSKRDPNPGVKERLSSLAKEGGFVEVELDSDFSL